MKISFINKALLALSLAYLGGCTTTQTDLIQASKLAETPHAEQQRSNCMSEQQVFTSRNSMVSTAAIESAWVYCKRYSDFWYPGRDEADYTSGWDTQVEEQKDFAPRLSRPE